MGKYWDIGQILPYQRHWNFINGPREIGKTYTTQKWLLKQAFEKHKEFIYICRTQEEKKNGVLGRAFAKVCEREYDNIEFKSDHFKLTGNGVVLGYCVAISEYIKIKKYSFPKVYYMMFDEYMLEKDDGYWKGWREPELLLNIYQTVDRGRDEVIVFMLGNNTSFYNPYHMNPAFNIPLIEPGKIWKSKNVLFQYAIPSEQMKKEISKKSFTKLIENTDYGRYATDGKYIEDRMDFLSHLGPRSKYMFTVFSDGFSFGVYSDSSKGEVIVSDKVDDSCKIKFALTLEDHRENTLIVPHSQVHLKWFSDLYKRGAVKFDSMRVKSQSQGMIRKVVR